MSEVFIIGYGLLPVGKYPDICLGEMGAISIRNALQQAQIDKSEVSALYVGNMLSGILCQQQLAAALVANKAGLEGIETFTAEGACASGAAAFRLGYMAIASRSHSVVAVCGVEKMTHSQREVTTSALATASDWATEGSKGKTFLSLNADLMNNYMSHHQVDHQRFAGFSVNAHKNAYNNPHAMLKREIDENDYLNSKEIIRPLKLLDAPPICDGAATVLLADKATAMYYKRLGIPISRVIASAVACDQIALSSRSDISRLISAERSSAKAYKSAKVSISDISLFEPHDAYTVMTTLSLESIGFAPYGQGTNFAEPSYISIDGELPICTFGGLKARGHPVGATGVYQIAECHMQLSSKAEKNQVNGAEIAMAQNLAGAGTIAFTNIMEAY